MTDEELAQVREQHRATALRYPDTAHVLPRYEEVGALLAHIEAMATVVETARVVRDDQRERMWPVTAPLCRAVDVLDAQGTPRSAVKQPVPGTEAWHQKRFIDAVDDVLKHCVGPLFLGEIEDLKIAREGAQPFLNYIEVLEERVEILREALEVARPFAHGEVKYEARVALTMALATVDAERQRSRS